VSDGAEGSELRGLHHLPEEVGVGHPVVRKHLAAQSETTDEVPRAGGLPGKPTRDVAGEGLQYSVAGGLEAAGEEDAPGAGIG
jgi:hypothetical protein